jgi:hypothetical protein
VCRIAVLGDSHVAAIATREEDTLVAQLEKRLNHAGQAARWEVLNFGISGASTAQELALYRKVVRQYDPDLVICAYFEGNDFSDNSERLSGSPRIYMDIDAEGRLRQKPGSGTWSAGSGWLNRNSRFYVWQKIALRNAIANLRTAMDLGIDEGDLTFSLEPRDELRHAWKLTEALVRKFAEEVTADGREFLLLYIPTAETLYPELWQRKLRRRSYQRARLDPENALRHFRRIASEGEIDALFLNERFSSVIGGRRVSDRRAWLYFGANGHLNERAQALAADEIVDQLMRSGRLGACRSR